MGYVQELQAIYKINDGIFKKMARTDNNAIPNENFSPISYKEIKYHNKSYKEKLL